MKIAELSKGIPLSTTRLSKSTRPVVVHPLLPERKALSEESLYILRLKFEFVKVTLLSAWCQYLEGGGKNEKIIMNRVVSENNVAGTVYL
jgi:hypothetical protein